MTKCCNVKAGDLRESITVQQQILVPGDMGGQDLSWLDRFNARAGIKMNSGDERNNHGKLEVRATHTITIRFNRGIIETDRVRHVKNGRIIYYDIKSIENVEERNKWIVLKADRGGPS